MKIRGGSDRRATDREAFIGFVRETEPRLRRALVAAYGAERGREATAEALAYAWEHWDRVREMGNPAGYLYRVGLTAGRRESRRRGRAELRADVDTRVTQEDQLPDPDLRHAVEGLSPRQRAAVVMVVGHGMPLREAAELLGCSISSLRNHVDRALRRLRTQLGDDDVDQ